MKPLAYIAVILASAGLAVGLATGNLSIGEAAFLKLLWFGAGALLSLAVYFLSWAERSDWETHVRERKEREQLGLSLIPMIIVTFLYVLGRAIALG